MVACVTLCGVAYADEFKMPEGIVTSSKKRLDRRALLTS
jgi:hypothetical protein